MGFGVRIRRWLAFGAAFVVLLAGATAARAQDQQTTPPAQQPPDPMVKPVDHSMDPGMVVPAPRGVDPRFAPKSFGTVTAGLPPKPQPQNNAYEPITAEERIEWIAVKTLGPDDLIAGVVWSGYGTAVNKPPEDGPHWGGFGERYGVRLTGIATSNVMEAGLGAMWGEDPRYKSARGKNFGPRVWSVVEQTFMTRRRDGHFAPAYARYMAIPGSNFLANTWRPDSEADSYHAGIRTLEGFGGVLGSNTWEEFWPSVRDRMFHRH
jgi:hypothetical protein